MSAILSQLSGYGTGISGNGHRVAFTYGLSREQSILYLGLGSASARKTSLR